MIVSDTHALLWWVDGVSQLSKVAGEAIDQTQADQRQIWVSAISAWEIAMLVRRGRLVLSMELNIWLATVAEVEQVEFVPVDVALALQSVNLPDEFTW